MSAPLYAAIELGGTKTICLLGHSVDQIVDELRVPTRTPEQTLGEVLSFLQQHTALAGIGIASFGPVVIDSKASDYGTITTTPKQGWKNFKLLQFFAQHFTCPIRLDTDVNAAGIAEYHLGAAQGLRNFIYVTVGTGIGGGALINGIPVRGLSHPEMGHIGLRRIKGDKNFVSTCAFHASCAEGLASGTAIYQRWGAALNEWSDEHLAWEYQADYLAEFSHTLTLLYSPQRIIFGGGVSSEPLLIKMREKLSEKNNGYIQAIEKKGMLENYLCLPKLGGRAGPLGAFMLALPDDKARASQGLGRVLAADITGSKK